MPSFKVASAAIALLSYVPNVLGDCQSYGLDFQSGNTYFQNINSTDPFTASQEFEGCQSDQAHNVLVNPQGDQSECTESPLQPDNTPQLVTCSQWPKDQLYTGDWSLLIISNNGNADPIAFERDFALTVGTQATTTVTPTVTVSNIETPIVNITSTAYETDTITGDATTITSGQQTRTVTPKAVTTTVTRGLLTLTQQTQTWSVASSTETVPASCSVQATRRVADPIASIVPSVLGELNQVVENILDLNRGILSGLGGLIGFNRISPRDMPASAKFKREIIAGRSPSAELKAAFVKERRSMLEKRNLGKRAPDEATTTVTATDLVTSTIGSQVPTTTQTITSTQTNYVTLQTTVTAGPVTVTASGRTSIKTKVDAIVQVTRTQTKTTTIVNTVTTTSAGAAASCASRGGVLI